MSDETVSPRDYRLDKQVGYLLRLANQRHALIFQQLMRDGLTPTQFSTLMRLAEHGPVSQNHLGRLTGMDVATTKGVVDRLRAKTLVRSQQDPGDKRRSIISLTSEGDAMIGGLKELGVGITAQTLEPLSKDEQKTLRELLEKII